MSHVLIIDDEPSICWGFQRLLTRAGHTVAVTSSAEEGLRQARERTPDAVLLDVRLPGMDGLSAVQHLHQQCGPVPVILMTAFGSLETAVRAIETGAVEYLPKPFELDEAVSLISRMLHRPSVATERIAGTSAPEASAPDEIVGQSRAIQEVFKQIALAARGDVPVLITGESGTGKELVARAIHRHSTRAPRPFLPVSLPALSPAVVESELFGHVRGAFTGAESERAGVFELASGGTVLLDEIGDVTAQIQVKLLRAIERKEIQRVGDLRPRNADFRVIAATHRDLTALIQSGQFREDLFYRLSVFQIRLPPLRERLEDLPLLARHFLTRARPDDPELHFHPDALDALAAREWPGNVRELRNAVEHAAIVCRTPQIGPEAFPPVIGGVQSATSPELSLQQSVRQWTADMLTGSPNGPALQLHDRLLQVLEPELLRAVLANSAGNRAAAAERLGMHRATLRQKLRRYGMDGPGDPEEC